MRRLRVRATESQGDLLELCPAVGCAGVAPRVPRRWDRIHADVVRLQSRKGPLSTCAGSARHRRVLAQPLREVEERPEWPATADADRAGFAWAGQKLAKWAWFSRLKVCERWHEDLQSIRVSV